jgi:hypothetical protein
MINEGVLSVGFGENDTKKEMSMRRGRSLRSRFSQVQRAMRTEGARCVSQQDPIYGGWTDKNSRFGFDDNREAQKDSLSRSRAMTMRKDRPIHQRYSRITSRFSHSFLISTILLL